MKHTNKKFILYLLLTACLIFFIGTGFTYDTQESECTKKTMYITFDDGPSAVTSEVLDILKEHNIKATFFVVGQQFKGNEEILKRIHEEGHSLGLHSYTHNFSKLYRGNIVNKDLFINEMLQCQAELKEIIGVETNILRFPGGSHKRLSEGLLSELKKHNLKVYDWTHSSEDGANTKAPPSVLFRKSLKKIPSSKKAPGAILLMHCNTSNVNSAKVLPDIIKHFKEEGYEFLKITPDTPEYHCE